MPSLQAKMRNSNLLLLGGAVKARNFQLLSRVLTRVRTRFYTATTKGKERIIFVQMCTVAIV